MKRFLGAIGRCVLLAFAFAAAGMPSAQAAADVERSAREAMPTSGKALLYVYRRQDGGNKIVPLLLNGKEVTKLSPLTFGLWNVASGRTEIRAEGRTLALQCEPGRIYFVELSSSAIGTSLKQVSYAVGRQQTFQARLAPGVGVASTSPKRIAEPAPKPKTTPSPAKATPAPKPASRKRVSASRAGSGDSFVLSLKTGSLSLASAEQEFVGAAQSFDTGATAFALEGEYFMDPQFAFGGEYIRYENDYGNGVIDGSMTTTIYLGNARYYFTESESAWRPYVGAGIGTAVLDLTGPAVGSVGGMAWQAQAGLLWHRESVGVRAEYKSIRAEAEDDDGNQVDASASGFFLGVTLHF